MIWLCLTIWRDHWMTRPNFPKLKQRLFFRDQILRNRNWNPQKLTKVSKPRGFKTEMSISRRDVLVKLTLFDDRLCLTIWRAPFAQTILPAAWARSRWIPSTMSRRCRSWTKPLTSLGSSGKHKFLTKFGDGPELLWNKTKMFRDEKIDVYRVTSCCMVLSQLEFQVNDQSANILAQTDCENISS